MSSASPTSHPDGPVPPAATARPAIVLDCDPGLDDAVAIALALDLTEVVAVTSVGGNVGIERTTTNALALTELLGRADVPVHRGHDEPFAAAPVQRAAAVHGAGGLGDVVLPPPGRPVASDDAAGAMIEASHRVDDLWLVATGPLTNVAHAVTADPTIVERVAGLSWMGGSSTYGNVTAAAEFNAWADPEAADVVLRAGFRTMYQLGLNVTHTVLLTPDWIGRLGEAVRGTTMSVFADLLRSYLRGQATVSVLGGAAIHDALALLRLTHPGLFSGTHRHVQMVLEGVARGMTLVDERPRPSDGDEQVEVVEWADDDALRAVMWACLTHVDRG